MRPKEFYEQLTIQEDKKYIFTLMDSDFEGLYKKFLKKPIEEIKLDGGKITCESYLDFDPGIDKLDTIWTCIQKASIIIANITDFKPDVMFELGVALMKKGRVILIAEKSIGNEPKPPLNLSKMGIEYYDLDNLDLFSRKLVNHVKKIIPTDHKTLKHGTQKLMRQALKHRRGGDYETVFVLFKEMNEKEPKNWYIYKEWAITHEFDKKYEEALSMLNQALEFATTDRQKAEIHTALGVVYRKSEMEEKALSSFQQAENLYTDDADLYDKWAFLYHTIGKYQEAMNKMMRAIKLDANNKDFIWKLEYYTKKFSDRNFRKPLKIWLSEKRELDRKNFQKKGTLYNDTFTRHPNRQSTNRNDPQAYKRFTQKYNVGEMVTGIINNINSKFGIFVQLEFNIIGLIHANKKGRLPRNFDVNDRYKVGMEITAEYLYYDNNDYRIGLANID